MLCALLFPCILPLVILIKNDVGIFGLALCSVCVDRRNVHRFLLETIATVALVGTYSERAEGEREGKRE